MKELASDRQDNEDESGYLFYLHDKMREVVTEYNDTIKGRCAVCLENLGANAEDTQGFTDRYDLIRINDCYHRFHLICVHRDWFMPRVCEKDDFGGVL